MRHAWRTPTALALAALTLFAPAGGVGRAQPGSCPNPTAPEMDLRDGYFVNLEEGPVHPLELSADGKELWAVNIPDASVVVFDATIPTQLKQKAVVKVGLGPVTVRRRPGDANSEMWVVCQSSNAVFVIDSVTKRLKDSIRLTHEPAGLVFDKTGARAWVTLGATNQVAEVNAATRTLTTTLEFATTFPDPTSAAIHAEEPRALLLDGSDLFVLSFESGNGTFGLNGLLFPNTVDDLWGYYGSGVSPVPPPDRDVLRLTVPGGPPAATVALWRAGSINFDLQKDDAGELWVSNVDYNNTLVGEHQFPAQLIARHRVTHAPPLAPGTPAPTVPPASVDLNTAVLAGLKSAGYACAMPNEMAFSADFDTLYVACYETHNVAVVDLSGPSPLVVSELRGLVGLPRPQNVGVRGLALDEAAGVLFTYSRDSRVQSYAVPAVAGAVNTPLQTVAVGFDITPRKVLEGRFHNINALRAASKVQSCNTCHIDGHLDRLAWDLSDKTGDLTVAAPLGRVSKETKVTMTLRGIEETAPFHWQGDRADLTAFNPAFQGLLGAPQLSASEMAAFSDFVFTLSYPANPRQPLDRTITDAAQPGLAAFKCLPAHDVSFDTDVTNPPVGVSCQSCHGMAGGSGTNNQVNNDIVGLLAEDGTQLRGLFDKESDIVDYSAYLPAHLQFMPATLWGFASSGFVDTVADFVNIGVFNLITQAQRDDIVKFLDEFDTGMPPAAAYAWTLKQANAGAPSPPSLTLLKPQADLGNIDLIVRGWQSVSGVTRNIGLLYDPATNTYLPDTTALGSQTYANLVARAAAGRAVYAFIGVPRRSGTRLAIDQEMDWARDGDEAAAGAVVGRADSDSDGFPDGYEMRLGSLPGAGGSLPPAEAVAPGFLPAPPQVSWVNGSLAKVRWTTDEESTSRVEVHPAGLVGVPLAVREDIQFKQEHVLVVRGLQPGTYDFHVKSTDPAAAGNTGTAVIPNVVVAPPDFQSVRVAQTTLTAAPALPGNPVQLTATFQLVDETGAAIANGATVTFNQVEWIPGAGNSGASPQSRTTNPSVGGIASLTFTAHHLAGAGAKAEVHATAVTEPTTNRLYFHPLDGQFGFWAQTALP